MLLRVVLVAALVAALMVAVKDGRVLRHAGLTGSCSSVATPAGQSGSWKACRAGRLEGRPDLSRDSCTSVERVGPLEYWRCPAPLGTGRGT